MGCRLQPPPWGGGAPTEFERLLEAQHQQEEEKTVGGCEGGEGGLGPHSSGSSSTSATGASSHVIYGTSRASSVMVLTSEGSIRGSSDAHGAGERFSTTSTGTTAPVFPTGSSFSSVSTDPGVRSSTSSDISDTSASSALSSRPPHSPFPQTAAPQMATATTTTVTTTTASSAILHPLPLANRNPSQEHHMASSPRSGPTHHPAAQTPASSASSTAPPPFQSMVNGAHPAGGGAVKPRTPYNVFLDRLKHPSCALVVASVKRFVETFPPSLTREQAARRIHPFLSQTQATLLKADVFANFARTEADQQQVMEGLERFVLQKLHGLLFRDTPEDVKENAYLRKKIFCLSSWVELHHLEIPDLPNISALSLGAREIQRLDKMKCPRDKLVLILNCCRVVIAVLDAARKASGCDTPPAADDLLPLLIYTLLQARPHCLHSHIQFISYFRHPSRLVSEEAYFFTHFCSAVEFVKVVGVQPGVGLNDVSPEEFEARMQVAEEEYQRFLAASQTEAEEAARKEEQEKKDAGTLLMRTNLNHHKSPQKSFLPSDPSDQRHIAASSRTHADEGGVDASAGSAGLSAGPGSSGVAEPSLVSSTTKISKSTSQSQLKTQQNPGQLPGAPAALAAAASALSTLEHLSASSNSAPGDHPASTSIPQNHLRDGTEKKSARNGHEVEAGLLAARGGKKGVSSEGGESGGRGTGGGRDFVVYRRQGVEFLLKEISDVPRTFESLRSIEDLRVKDLHALLQEYQQMSMVLSQVSGYLAKEHLNVPHRK